MGETFVPKDCHARCKCVSSNGVACLPLCGLMGIYCAPGTRKVQINVPVPGTSCTCPNYKCA